ncbi:TolC family protein [Bremerella alba]|uniref:Solvent efflux pump outer membrane protein SrpC n=1 Tax=Bremerella alba TaxID=980252 RepID=A0A7V8V8E2_9BACT|nr:TolC family protein [Bremerella alba]MBA2116838.1 Solvent efflux pump outer membrane protein SrpC [Bremerella alba]
MRPFYPYAHKAITGCKPLLVVTILACLTLTSLVGCGIPDLCCVDPTPYVPGDYGVEPNSVNVAEVGVYDFFNDPALAQLIAEGLASNQELKIRNQEVQLALNEITARRGAYLPFVSVGADGGFERTSKWTPLGAAEDQLFTPNGGEFPDPLPNVGLTANLFWRVDIWRELRNARDAASQRYAEAVEIRDYYVTRLVAEIAENYYELTALDQRLVYLNQTIDIQKQSLEVAKAQKEAARGTELPVQRFLAEVRKNESQRLIVQQDIIEAENKINFLVGRYPQPVARGAWEFIQLDSKMLGVGAPAELLQNRRDIRAAERELAASGLDVLVARAQFFPSLDIRASVGYEAFNPRYLFDPGAFIASTAGELVAPLINKKAIQAEYRSANARQIQAVYDYQRTVLNAYTEVVNQVSKAHNYRKSVEIKQSQVVALEQSVDVATNLFQNARSEYVDVLFSQRDLLEARIDMIETKQQQLSAIVKAYQALGGGYLLTNSGLTYKDIRCLDTPYLPGEFIDVPVVNESEENFGVQEENLPPLPSEVDLSPTPLGSAK